MSSSFLKFNHRNAVDSSVHHQFYRRSHRMCPDSRLEINKRYYNHNGGCTAFGPDGYQLGSTSFQLQAT